MRNAPGNAPDIINIEATIPFCTDARSATGVSHESNAPKRRVDNNDNGCESESDALVFHESLFVEDSPTLPDAVQGEQHVEHPVSRVPPKRNKTVTGSARPPPPGFKKYNTNRYKVYDNHNPQSVELVPGPFTKFGSYDHYSLFIWPRGGDTKDVPISGVRIDDLTLSRVLGGMKARTLHTNWPADIDQAGMVRGTRMPLGKPAKMLVKAGDKDIDGNIINVEDEGYYYKWWRGLHCLMGHEGFEAGMYRIRPAFEQFRCSGFAFKKAYKAVVQEAEDI